MVEDMSKPMGAQSPKSQKITNEERKADSTEKNVVVFFEVQSFILCFHAKPTPVGTTLDPIPDVNIPVYLCQAP